MKLCDFGISESTSAGGGGGGGGDGGGGAGTPLEVEDKGTSEYMAPECFARLLSGSVKKSLPTRNATVAVGDGGGDALAALRYVRAGIVRVRTPGARTRDANARARARALARVCAECVNSPEPRNMLLLPSSQLRG